MRLTGFGFVLVLMTGLLAGRTNAQIPERALFHPGSYAYGMAQTRQADGNVIIMEKVLVEAPAAEAAVDADSQTDWEKNFAVKKPTEKVFVEIEVPVQGAVTAESGTGKPYLAYHRNPWTHRIHVIPYQPGYAAAPEQFPQHQSQWNLWLSSLPCREQNRPQIQYLGYYDPMPEILTDKPSRLQLILGYPNPDWTTCCDNRWGVRMAQCPGVVPPAVGPFAERSVSDQICEQPASDAGPLGGILAGPRPIDYGPMGPPSRQGLFPGKGAMPYPPTAGLCPCVEPMPQVMPVPTPAPIPAVKKQPCTKPGCKRCAKQCKQSKPCPTNKKVPHPPVRKPYPVPDKSFDSEPV